MKGWAEEEGEAYRRLWVLRGLWEMTSIWHAIGMGKISKLGFYGMVKACGCRVVLCDRQSLEIVWKEVSAMLLHPLSFRQLSKLRSAYIRDPGAFDAFTDGLA